MVKVLEENQLLKRRLEILESAPGRRLQGNSGTEVMLHSPMSFALEEVTGLGVQSGEGREFSECCVKGWANGLGFIFRPPWLGLGSWNVGAAG